MLDIGCTLDGKYSVIKILGEGGMSTVYLCKNTRLGNLWAVKEIKSEWKDKVDFLAEPNILKKLNHTGIPRIVDIFYENENLYMVEDYIEGITLKEYVEIRGKLSSELIMDITLQLCDILQYLHNFNPPIIYRDLKPSNIMIKPDNKVVLIDFGIARTYKEGQTGDTIVLGSRGYIAPEQLMHVQSNVQTDIYSLGATMYFMSTGNAPEPFNVSSHLSDNFSDLDKNLSEVILKTLLTDTKSRYSKVYDLKKDLQVSFSKLQYDKTKLIHNPQAENAISKTIAIPGKSRKNRHSFIIIVILMCIVLLIIPITSWLNNKNKKNLSSAYSTPVQNTEIKKDASEPPKENEEKDILVRGILFKDKPQILGSSSTASKGKGKDKKRDENVPLHLLFDLEPDASIANSKFKIYVTKFEITEDYVIAYLLFDNKTNNIINLDIGKTYLVNGENKYYKCSNSSTANQLSVPKNTNSQQIKLYFTDFDFKGSTYTIKTSLNTGLSKDINFYIDIK